MGETETSDLFGGRRNKNNKHNVVSASLIFVAFVAFAIAATFNGLSGSGAAPQIFKSSVSNLSAKYDLEITPAGFTFSIWSIIYLWIAASLVTLIVTIFASNSQGRIYQNPEFASPLLMIVMTVNFILNLTWIFLWDREQIVAAAVILASLAVSGMVVVGLMARNIFNHKEEYSKGRPMFLWSIVYWLMMNGFGVYTTWCVIAGLINFTHALVYSAELDMKGSCLASLSLLVVIHSTWFILENTVLDKYVRFLLTPYLVVMWASNGIRSTYSTPEKANVPPEIQDYVLAILIIASITLVLRVIIVVIRTIKDGKSAVMTIEGSNEMK